jgi:hypothetical protein
MGGMPYRDLGGMPDVDGGAMAYSGANFRSTRRPSVDRCPICQLPIEQAIVLCSQCGEELPLRVVVISEGSDGASLFAVVREKPTEMRMASVKSEEVDDERCANRAGSRT